MLTASMSTVQSTAQGRQFPKFDLSRLLGTVFKPTFGRTICILIDLPDLAEAKDYAFLNNPARAIQRRAHDYFYQGLKNGVADELVGVVVRRPPMVQSTFANGADQQF